MTSVDGRQAGIWLVLCHLCGLVAATLHLEHDRALELANRHDYTHEGR